MTVSPQNLDYINQRWAQLYNLTKEWSNTCIHYLFLANSGGAIAMLSFMGARGHVHVLVVWGLVVMLFGLVLVGILMATTYHRMFNLFSAWRKDVKEFFLNRISWEKLVQDDEDRAKVDIIDYFLGYGSFLSFIIGITLGIWGLLIQ
ncbi:MAG: hypothetical protein KGJ95_08180 [Candidatus Omnitrophica bacterium]|nr:hypothetical protein [Candidatus Omnitrophota bacterium]